MLLMEHLVHMTRCQEGKLSSEQEIIAVILQGTGGIKILKNVTSFINFIFHLAASSQGSTIFLDLCNYRPFIYIIVSTYIAF